MSEDWLQSQAAGSVRNKPYFWVTWIAKALVGDVTCRLSLWFRVNRERYKKLDGGGSLHNWKVKHTALIEEIVTGIVSEHPDTTVTLEDENSLTVYGSTATVGGKPDVVERGDGWIHVYDAKTGAPADKDKAQMWLYRYLSKLLNPALRVGLTLVYGAWPGVPVTIEDEESLRQATLKWIKELSSAEPPEARPSVRECEDCDISACPFRSQAKRTAGNTEEF